MFFLIFVDFIALFNGLCQVPFRIGVEHPDFKKMLFDPGDRILFLLSLIKSHLAFLLLRLIVALKLVI